jgi:hypothetical protein
MSIITDLGPHEIISGVWLGNSYNARNWQELEKLGIRSVLNIAWDLDYKVSPNVFPVKVGLVDGPGNRYAAFSLAVKTLEELIKMGTVLIHCHEGVSRSPTILAAYMVKNHLAKNLDDAFNLIAAKRPQINPKKVMMELAKDYLDQEMKEI